MTDFDAYLNGEYARWRGKPKMSCFVLECIFNPLLFIALIWAAFDLFFYTMVRKMPSGEMGGIFKGFVGVFLLIHMMPVWIYLGGVIFSVFRQRNIEYAITDRGIYFSRGVLSKEIVFKPFAEITNVSMTRGMIDRMTGCGDVNIICGGRYSTGAGVGSNNFSIRDIPDYQEVFAMVRRMQTDIYADTMYPNALRPENNPGYQTQYQPTDRRY
ncbi:MAG: PH domain-containing protein [Lachnospiraceae bacterium]|nr:PH domain-containing protein [Lachnospiraceae bacterium]